MCVAGPRTFRDPAARPLRVATKFPNIAKSYYASRSREIDIIKLNGSIELAPLTGLSDVIVDIVESGKTLKENDLCVRDWDEVLGYFAKIIDRVHANCPDVQLIIEAELPVRKAFYDKTPPWNEFNIGLKALCDEKDVTFLDFTAPLTDENGELIKAHCGDGKCHLNIAGEEIWVRALRRFAVEQTHIGDFVFEPIH